MTNQPPWIAVEQPQLVASLLRDANLLGPAEALQAVERAGEGNMNVTLRAVLARQSVIVKQSRPWVAKYPAIAAPLERIYFESRFYELVAQESAIAARMPRLLAALPLHYAIVLEDLGRDACDATVLYADRRRARAEIDALGGPLIDWLAALHAWSRTQAIGSEMENRQLRLLNHAHIFVVPFAEPPALDLDSVTPGLADVAAQIRKTPGLADTCRQLGELYRCESAAPVSDAEGPALPCPGSSTTSTTAPVAAAGSANPTVLPSASPVLLHGDFFPGSWILSPGGDVYVIDPEFCFVGPAEFDLGVFAAHLRILQIPAGTIDTLLSRYAAASSSFDESLVRQFAAVEILRRLLGVAQLPLSAWSLGEKQALLQAALRDLMSG